MKKIFLTFSIIAALFACALLAVNPNYADRLYDEGGVFENLTVFICIMALILSIYLLLIRFKKKSGYLFWLFLSVLLIIFIGDEISWGMGYFGFTKHRIAGVGLDGAHDILSIGIGAIKQVRDYVRSVGVTSVESLAILLGSAFAIIIVCAFLIRWIVRRRKDLSRFFSENLRWEPFLFLFIGIILLLVAMVIDDDNLIGFPHKAVVEETLEFIAAASFLFGCLSGVMEVKSLKRKV